MAIREYVGVAEIQINGRTLAEAKTLRTNTAANRTPVRTMRRGLAGSSGGAIETRISIDNAIPKAGRELEWIDECQKGTPVRVTLLSAGKRFEWNGWIDSTDGSFGVSEDASDAVEIIAGPASIS